MASSSWTPPGSQRIPTKRWTCASSPGPGWISARGFQQADAGLRGSKRSACENVARQPPVACHSSPLGSWTMALSVQDSRLGVTWPRPLPLRVPPVTRVGRRSAVISGRPPNSPSTQPAVAKSPARRASRRSPQPRTRRTVPPPDDRAPRPIPPAAPNRINEIAAPKTLASWPPNRRFQMSTRQEADRASGPRRRGRRVRGTDARRRSSPRIGWRPAARA